MRKSGVALLLETIFGLGLFAVALVVSLGLIFVVSKGSDSAREYEIAEQVGRQELELTLAKKPAGASVGPVTTLPVPYRTGGGSDRTLYLNVNVTVTAPATPYRDVLVNVTWDTGVPRQILLEGYSAY